MNSGFKKQIIYFALLGLLSVAPALRASTITSVSEIFATQTQVITIAGSGFGTLNPYVGDSNYIGIVDVTATPAWEAGYQTNLVTLGVTSWTDTLITLSGFSGYYGYSNWTLQNGDSLLIQVWNAQTGAGLSTFTSVVGVAPVPVPAAIWLFGSALVGFLGFNRRKTS